MGERIDDLDWRILSVLATDARVPNAQIAGQVNTSEATVRRRICKLIDKGVIEIVAALHPEKIGLGVRVFIGCDVALDKIHQAAKALAALKPVRYIAYASGRYDFVVQAFFSSEQELFEFLTDEMPQVPGIINTETIRILKVVKRIWNFLPDTLPMSKIE